MIKKNADPPGVRVYVLREPVLRPEGPFWPLGGVRRDALLWSLHILAFNSMAGRPKRNRVHWLVPSAPFAAAANSLQFQVSGQRVGQFPVDAFGPFSQARS
jgi:hypothetical protein